MEPIEPTRGYLAEEFSPTIESARAPGDYRFANKRGRSDLNREKHDGQTPVVVDDDDDEVVLSDVANVVLLEEEGLSANAIAAGLGLTTAEVLCDLKIAAEICHSASSGGGSS